VHRHGGVDGRVLLAAGTKGKRSVLANSQVMLHQPLIGGVLQGPRRTWASKRSTCSACATGSIS
jgi:ATP-dependent protease ClpP protease subunit